MNIEQGITNDEGKKDSRKGAKAQEKNMNAKDFSPLVKMMELQGMKSFILGYGRVLICFFGAKGSLK